MWLMDFGCSHLMTKVAIWFSNFTHLFSCLTLVGFGLWLFYVLDVFDSCGIWLVPFLCALLVLVVIAFLIA
jgi:hypothetical protein